MTFPEESSNHPRIAIMGVGNILFTDEGIGIYATEFLKQNYQFSPTIDLIDGGTLGMNLIHYYQSYDHLLLLDTISVGDANTPGEVYSLNSDVLQGMGQYRQTAHEVEVLQTLELGALAGEIAQVQIIAMVPQDIETVAFELTRPIRQNIGLFINSVIQQLKTLGVTVTPSDSPATLDAIIEQFSQVSASA
ncbi:MAG: HyaD/HybD family hydrogenase maturation endopeptidase [Hydrogenovibrio crunogenus]|uniref:Hydrogenase maturation protease n=1 Tax=Hydrogenovibrio crunogenus (strain DSM 25203 / XCL-2) TaxID=317025 RepID=Q31DZ7_HYDCU|nr:HyaD/HybD family hydrogenase maturation endopeptidase [Hydrogenovibrio crunogenus]